MSMNYLPSPATGYSPSSPRIPVPDSMLNPDTLSRLFVSRYQDNSLALGVIVQGITKEMVDIGFAEEDQYVLLSYNLSSYGRAAPPNHVFLPSGSFLVTSGVASVVGVVPFCYSTADLLRLSFDAESMLGGHYENSDR